MKAEIHLSFDNMLDLYDFIRSIAFTGPLEYTVSSGIIEALPPPTPVRESEVVKEMVIKAQESIPHKDGRPVIQILKCPVCDSEFNQKRKDQTVCSIKCRNLLSSRQARAKRENQESKIPAKNVNGLLDDLKKKYPIKKEVERPEIPRG